MKDTMNNIALGLGVAVIGFALYRYYKGQAGGSTSSGSSSSSAPAWQNITFPLGTPTGATNTLAGIDQVYGGLAGVGGSMSWNPDAIGALIGQDTVAAMAATGQSMSNQYGFSTVPGAA